VGRRTKARECAFQILYQAELSGQGIEHGVEGFWRVRTTTDHTRARSEQLARGAWANRERADEAIRAVARNWALERIAAVDRSILRLGCYELMQEPATPPAVVIDEAVELAKRFGEADSGGFVNGILDAIRRRIAEQRPDGTEAKGVGRS
jgi:N utilization substance protein B